MDESAVTGTQTKPDSHSVSRSLRPVHKQVMTRLFSAVCDVLYVIGANRAQPLIASLDLIRIICRLAEAPKQLVAVQDSALYALEMVESGDGGMRVGECTLIAERDICSDAEEHECVSTTIALDARITTGDGGGGVDQITRGFVISVVPDLCTIRVFKSTLEDVATPVPVAAAAADRLFAVARPHFHNEFWSWQFLNPQFNAKRGVLLHIPIDPADTKWFVGWDQAVCIAISPVPVPVPVPVSLNQSMPVPIPVPVITGSIFAIWSKFTDLNHTPIATHRAKYKSLLARFDLFAPTQLHSVDQPPAAMKRTDLPPPPFDRIKWRWLSIRSRKWYICVVDVDVT